MLPNTLQDATEMLAHLAVGCREEPLSFAEKQATGVSDYLSGFGNTLQQNPAMLSTLIGTGAGAGLGGLHTALTNRNRDPEAKKSVLGGMATGALAGGALGGGIGLARHSLHGFGGGGDGPAAVSPGEYTDPATGQRMRIDPDVLRKNPGLAGEVRQLQRPTAQSHAASTVWEGAKHLWNQAPVASSILPALGLADASLHMPGVGLARVQPENVGGSVGRRLLTQGVEGAKELPDIIKNTLLKGKPGGRAPDSANPTAQRVTAGGISDGKRTVMDILGGGKRMPSRGSDGPALTVEHMPQREITREIETGVDSSGKPLRDKFVDKFPGDPETASIGHDRIGQLKNTAYEGSKRYADRSLFQLPKTRLSYAGFKSPLAALAWRLGIGGGLYGGEYLGRGMLQDLGDSRRLDELARQYAKPIPETRK